MILCALVLKKGHMFCNNLKIQVLAIEQPLSTCAEQVCTNPRCSVLMSEAITPRSSPHSVSNSSKFGVSAALQKKQVLYAEQPIFVEQPLSTCAELVCTNPRCTILMSESLTPRSSPHLGLVAFSR